MSQEPGTHRPETGHHRLGPQVVGQRVVVRSLLPDGRATDVLGTCLSWTDDWVVIDRDGAEPVRIATDTVVTGKPVPPRPSVRNRLTPRQVQAHTLSLFPTVEVEHLGDWQLRWAPPYDGRVRRRANSVLAMGDPGVTRHEATQRVVDFFTSRDRQPLAQVVSGSDVERILLEIGWEPLAGSRAHCQLAATSRASRAAGRPREDVSFTEDGSRASASLPGARARAALDGDWVGLTDVRVDAELRRTGLATALVAELLDWGSSLGAITAWAHIGTDDQPALALGEKLGFITHHTFGFLTHG